MSLSELLSKCQNPPDIDITSNAILELLSLAQMNLGNFLVDLVNLMEDENEILSNRCYCSTFISFIIGPHSPQVGEWEQLPSDQKLKIKNSLISCLVIEDFTGSVIAAIAVEIPLGEWPQIIGILVEASSHDNLTYRLASLFIIETIFKKLSPGQLSTQDADTFLSALMNNMTLDSDFLYTALKAFCFSLIFARNKMANEHERAVIFETLFTCLKHSHSRTRIFAMACLQLIAKYYYEFLFFHIDIIFFKTLNHMVDDDEDVATQAFDLWRTISDIEEMFLIQNNGMCKYYCEDGLRATIKIYVMRRSAEIEMLKQDVWNSTKAANVLLSNMCPCSNDNLIYCLLKIFTESIQLVGVKARESTILAVESILKTIHETKYKSIVPEALPIRLFKDTSSKVKCTVAWCLNKITDYHSDIPAIHNSFDSFVNTIMAYFGSVKEEVVQILDPINLLLFSTRPDLFNPDTYCGFISKDMEALLPNMLKVAFTKDALSIQTLMYHYEKYFIEENEKEINIK